MKGARLRATAILVRALREFLGRRQLVLAYLINDLMMFTDGLKSLH